MLTNKPLGPSIGILEALGLRGFFSRIIGGDSEYGRKPDPAGLLALQALAPGERIVMVGDSPADWKTAEAAGVPFVFARYGFGAARFGAAPPDTPFVIDHARELDAARSAEADYLTATDQQLRRGARADRHALIVRALQAHAVRHFVARLDLDRLARLEVMALDEAQERRVLIGDARHRDRRVERAGQQRLERAMRELAVGGRNRIAVRIELGPAEHLVDALDQPIRHDVLHLLGVVVDLVPVHAHDLDEEQLDQAMAAQARARRVFRRRCVSRTPLYGS